MGKENNSEIIRGIDTISFDISIECSIFNAVLSCEGFTNHITE